MFNSETKPSPLQRMWWLTIGAACGSALMYLFDPDRGKRRRIFVRDKAVHLGNAAIDKGRRPLRRISHKAQGLYAKFTSRREAATDDDTLNCRVRSEFGRKVSHASAIETSVRDGVVTLKGPILAKEIASLLSCVERVPGVKGVINRLDVHATKERVPGLQGEAKVYAQETRH